MSDENRSLLTAQAIAALPEHARQHAFNPNGVRHTKSLGDACGLEQIGVHLVFFLHITTGPDNTNNVMALAFGVLIVFLVIGGTLWIMSQLDTNMSLPMNQLMQMQR